MMTSREIATQTAHKHGLTLAQLTGKSRCKSVSNARSEAMKRIRDELQMTYPAIGRVFNRTHSSVMYQVKKCPTIALDFQQV